MASSIFRVGQKVRVLRVIDRPDFDCYLPANGTIISKFSGKLWRVVVPAVPEAPGRMWSIDEKSMRVSDDLLDI